MKILSAFATFTFLALSSNVSMAEECDPGFHHPTNDPGICVPDTATSVPEPGSFALLAIGAGAAAFAWTRRRDKKVKL